MKIKNVWIIFLSIVSVLALSFGVYTQVAPTPQAAVMSESQYKITLDNYYRQSLYQLADSMKNINANLGKISVSNNAKQQQKLLLLVEGAADAASRDLALLPMNDDMVEKSLKYTNQVADYSKVLAERLYYGGSLSNDDRSNLTALENVSEALYGGLNGAAMSNNFMQNDEAIITENGETEYGGSGGAGGVVALEDIDESTFDYPQLIYDGPYSDAVVGKSVSFESKINAQQGEEYIRKAFTDYNISSIAFSGAVENKISAFAYDVITNGGESYRILLTSDGRVAQFDGYSASEAETSAADLDTMKTTAARFVNKLGYNVKPIWTSQPIKDRVYVNLCFVQGDTVVYPDMVKVALSLDGKVVGFEAFSYLANHKERKLTSDYSNIEMAISRLSDNVEIVGVNKAVIPSGKNEYHCYEFVCEKGDETYFIYLDVATLIERDILKVVDGIEGYSVI